MSNENQERERARHILPPGAERLAVAEAREIGGGATAMGKMVPMDSENRILLKPDGLYIIDVDI